jgi:predicted nucleic-acid-binding protein
LIALDTNALVRLLIDDDEKQAGIVKELIVSAEKQGRQILILTEVLIETVWVLESVYECTREDIHSFLETLAYTSAFTLSEPQIVINTIRHFRKGGDFADIIIVMQALNHQAKKMLSFDKKLQKLFPDFVLENFNDLES